jgi:hypothetical protein
VRATDDRVLFRLWTLGFTVPGAYGELGGDSYTMRYDLLNLFVSEEPGEQLP